MDKELKELMQISTISENKFLSEMLSDLTPMGTCYSANTNKENINMAKICAEKTDTARAMPSNQEFRIVVYKKENPLVRFFKGLGFALKKIRILGNSKEVSLAQSKSSKR